MGVFRVWEFLDSWGIINYQAGAAAADEGGNDGVPISVQPAGMQQPSCTLTHTNNLKACSERQLSPCSNYC